MRYTRTAYLIIANISIAFLYFVLGKVGLSISVLHVTPFWPPSGICLAAVLIIGRGLAPGIWLGAFFMNLPSFYRPDHLASSIAAATLASTGALLEAMAGSVLMQRFASGLNFLHRARNVFRFAYMGAFLSAAIAAVMGTLGL